MHSVSLGFIYLVLIVDDCFTILVLFLALTSFLIGPGIYEMKKIIQVSYLFFYRSVTQLVWGSTKGPMSKGTL